MPDCTWRIAELVSTATERLWQLADRLEQTIGFAEFVASLQTGHGATLDGVWGSSCALVAATLARHAPGPLVIVCSQPADIDDFCDDLSLFTEARPERLPAWEAFGREQTLADDVFGDRLRLLKLLGGGKAAKPARSADAECPRLVVASIQGLLQPVPDRQTLARQTRQLAVRAILDVRTRPPHQADSRARR